MAVATLEWSRRCSWIEWSLLTPLIPLVQPGGECHGPIGRYKNSICNYCKITMVYSAQYVSFIKMN